MKILGCLLTVLCLIMVLGHYKEVKAEPGEPSGTFACVWHGAVTLGHVYSLQQCYSLSVQYEEAVMGEKKHSNPRDCVEVLTPPHP